MAFEAIQIVLSLEIIQEINSLVGVEERDAFITECLKDTLRNHRILSSLAKEEPIWKDEDHPELAAMGTNAWVRSVRQENEERFTSLHSEE